MLQSEKAPSSMLVTLLEIDIPVSSVQPRKVELLMLSPLVILTTKEAGEACLATTLMFITDPAINLSSLQP